MIRAFIIFFVAGLAEIGGGYLIWQWLRNGRAIWMGILGGVVLFLYGIIATRQEFSSFGKVYAAYGGVFIVMSLLWGWAFDKTMPSGLEWAGAIVCLVGVVLILLAR